MKNRPQLLKWHFWSMLAVITARLEYRLGYQIWLHTVKWKFIDLANKAYPEGFPFLLGSYEGPDIGCQKGNRDEL